MIERKIEQVDEHDRRLLLAASVQGHQFDSVIVAEAADMDPAEVEDRLEKLERVHGFVKRGHEHEFPDRTLTLHYQFVHVLYQNMLYASLQPTRRNDAQRACRGSAASHHGDRRRPSPASWRSCSKARAILRRARTISSPPRGTRSACSLSARPCRCRIAVSSALRALPDGPGAKTAGARAADDQGARAAVDQRLGDPRS